MLHDKRSSISPIVFLLVALTLALMFSCSDQPTAPAKESAAGLNGSGTIDPGTTGSFLLGEVTDTSVAPGALQVWAMNVAFTESTGIATFDVQILNHSHRTLSLPVRFVIMRIRPDDIAVVDFDGVTGDDHPFYNFDQKLGGGDMLAPGDRTEPVTMKFHTVTARSFAIGFRIDIGPAPGTGTIAGTVFIDSNMDGERDRSCRCELGVPGITVAIEKMLENGDMVTLLTRTDSSGEYRFAGLREGVHRVFVAAPEDRWMVTSSNPLLVTLIKGTDGKVQDFLGANFGLYPRIPPNPPPVPATILFGPIVTGLFSPWGTEIDSAFVDSPSPLTVVYKYYLEMENPPFSMPSVIDSAQAWINDELIFTYRPAPPDSTWRPDRFERQIVQIPDSLVKIGERNTIRLSVKGDEWAALKWLVFKKP
jgi:hypothetical protein